MIDKNLQQVNDLPVNQYAKTLLSQYGGHPSPSEIHVLNLLRLNLESGRLNPTEDQEEALLNLIDLQTFNAKKAADLLNLNDLPNLSPQALIDELMERVNDIVSENLI